MEKVENTQIEELENIEEMEEKKFTQKEVDEIVKKRLNREKTKNADDLENLKNELNKKDNLLKCKEYLIDKNYPRELIEVIDTNDVETFKEKVEKLQKNIFSNIEPPLYTADPVPSENKGLTRQKRKPKDYRNLYD